MIVFRLVFVQLQSLGKTTIFLAKQDKIHFRFFSDNRKPEEPIEFIEFFDNRISVETIKNAVLDEQRLVFIFVRSKN